MAYTQLATAAAGISSPAQSSASAAGNSFNPIFSADGRHLVFVSHANNLVTNDDLGLSLDVFVRDLVSSNTLLVSVSANGSGGANADANYPSVSSNGHFIAFASRARNLVSGDTNDASDVFVRDVVNGTTRLVSVDVNGNSPVDPEPGINIPLSGYPEISANGRWVFFESRATNLVSTSAPLGSVNIYARDTWSNVTVLVTADTNGNPIFGKCELASTTPDARRVAFTTTNTTLVPGVLNLTGDIYVRDMQTGSNTWVSAKMRFRLFEPYSCPYGALSANGAFVSFMASTPTSTIVSRYDFSSDTTLLISWHNRSASPSSLTAFASNTGAGLQITADGTKGTFESDGNVYVWDVNSASGLAERITVCTNSCCFGGRGTVDNYDATSRPSLSHDGRFISFVSECAFGNTGAAYHRDLLTGANELISANTNGAVIELDVSSYAVVSPDGSLVAFPSLASDLAANDLNGASDIFLRDVNAEETELITKAQPAKPSATAFTHSFLGLNSISADGRFVVTLRYDDPSAFRDTNGWQDVFLSDVVTGVSVAASLNSNTYVTNFDGGAEPMVTFIENTNAYQSPGISADGSVIYAARHGLPVPGRTRIYGGMRTNLQAGAGFSLASRGTNVNEDGSSYAPSVSSNGMRMVFTSTSRDLVEGIFDNSFLSADVFLRRTTLETNGLLSGTNELISIAMSGVATGNGASSNAFISPDGRWVIFDSWAGDLVTNNTGGGPILLARDLSSNVTHLASVGPNGSSQWGYVPASAAISGNSRYVAFSSGNIYLTVHDLLTRASFIAENPVVVSPSLSYDGRFVAFVKQTFSSVPDQAYVRDLQVSQRDLVSANLAGAPANGTSSSPLVSSDGRYVVFLSKASDLVANDTNGASDIFVRDRLLGVTMLVSANAQGLPGNGPSSRPVMAADGRTVVFQSFASDLAGGDYNDKRDVFVLKLGGADTDGDGMDDDWEVAYFETRARDGSGDRDDDGVSDLQEFRTGTDPTNSDSVFRVLTVTPMGGGGTQVIWTGNPNRSYRVEFKDDLNAASWTALDGTVSWNGSTGSMTDVGVSGTLHRYYRVVRLP